jgi:hypothetical protein
MQDTISSEGGRLVEWEVRRALVVVVLLEEVTPLRVKVEFLREGWLVLGVGGGRDGERLTRG